MRQILPNFVGATILVLTTYSGQAQVLNNSVNIEIQPKQIVYDGVGDGPNNPADINIMGFLRLNNNVMPYYFPCLQYSAGTTTSFPHTYTNTSGYSFVSESGLPFGTTLTNFRIDAMENDHTACVYHSDATSPSGNGDDDRHNPNVTFQTNPPEITAFLRPAGFWSDNYGSYNGGWFQQVTNPWNYKIRTTWRFEHGNTCSDPLNFGTIGTNDFRGDNNSTAFDPNVVTQSSGQVELVYTDNGGTRPTSDVWYKFTLDNTCNVQISTDNNVTGAYDTHLTLYSDCNTVIKSNDDVGNAGSNSFASVISTKLCPGTYYVAVEGFYNNDNFGLTITTGPSLSDLTAQVQSITHVSCNGGADGVAVVTSNNYNNSFTLNTFGEDFSNLSAGTYNFECIDDNNCVAQNTVTITEPEAISYTPAITDVSCNGANDGSVDLGTVSGGTAPILIEITGGTLNGLSPGTYSLIVSDYNQCADTQEVVISEPSELTISGTTTPEAIGEDGSIDASVSGGTAPYNFSWSNSSTTEDLVDITSGLYTLTVTDANGCTTSEDFTVNSTVGLSEATLEANIFPNPTSGEVTIELDGEFRYKLTDTAGKIIFSGTGNNTELLDLAALQSGMYTLLLEVQESMIIKKIVKK